LAVEGLSAETRHATHHRNAFAIPVVFYLATF
jgi:hypothetical protein